MEGGRRLPFNSIARAFGMAVQGVRSSKRLSGWAYSETVVSQGTNYIDAASKAQSRELGKHRESSKQPQPREKERGRGSIELQLVAGGRGSREPQPREGGRGSRETPRGGEGGEIGV